MSASISGVSDLSAPIVSFARILSAQKDGTNVVAARRSKSIRNCQKSHIAACRVVVIAIAILRLKPLLNEPTAPTWPQHIAYSTLMPNRCMVIHGDLRGDRSMTMATFLKSSDSWELKIGGQKVSTRAATQSSPAHLGLADRGIMKSTWHSAPPFAQ